MTDDPKTWRPLFQLLREGSQGNLTDAFYEAGAQILPEVEDLSEWISEQEAGPDFRWYESIPGYSALVEFDFHPTEGFIADHIVLKFFGLDDGGEVMLVFLDGSTYWSHLPFVGSFRKSAPDGLLSLLLEGPVEGDPVFGAEYAEIPAQITNLRDDLITRDQLKQLCIAQLPALRDRLEEKYSTSGVQEWTDEDLEQEIGRLFDEAYG